MNLPENNTAPVLRPRVYWRLWLFDTAMVTAGLQFFLALQYGTLEFFGKACAMALLPLIPLLVLVGGGGSTVFALTRAWIERRALPRPAAQALLVGPALAVTLLLGLLGAFKSPAHRLDYICLGHAPASATRIRLAGYSTFLREEWLAGFKVGPTDFQSLVARAKLVPADNFEFGKILETSALKQSRLFQSLPPLNASLGYRRVFNEPTEHQRGRVYAVYDPATATAVVFREYHD